MKFLYYSILLVFILGACKTEQVVERESDFNKDWKFKLDLKEDAFAADYNDADWRTLDVPHDWSIEFPFDSVNGEGCTGYLPGGLGWYRKHFNIDVNSNEKVYVLFDGVYNNSEVWLNGNKLGKHPYGYSPFYYDLTEFLNLSGKENVIAVKVDRTRYADSRWYTGSGIYRNVKLIKTNKLHVPVWGTFITTPEVTAENASLDIQISLKNDLGTEETVDVVTEIYNSNNELVTSMSTDGVLVKEENEIVQEGTVSNPELWGVDSPKMYSAVTILKQNGVEVDRYKTPFGIRSIVFDAKKGFFLNGKNMKIKGVCLHHDGGLVGSAVPKEVWKRRLTVLKDGGCNAIRISHNPASKEFLELCDEMGMLVQDEFFDEWDYPKDKRLNCWERHDDYITRGYTEHFQELAEKDLKATMKSHRNHPSIIQWSIGNEIEWTYPRIRPATGFFDNMDWTGNYFFSPPPYSPEKIRKTYNELPALEYQIETTAKKLADWTRELDTTRPVISNCILPSASFETGYTDALDIVGFSYRRIIYDYARKHYPAKVVMGTENVCQWHEWKAIEERPFVSGTFLWTGIDYLGEKNEAWPEKATPSGLIDLAGFPKPAYHMYKSLWTEDPHVYIYTQNSDKSIFKVNNEGKVIEKVEGAWKHRNWFWHDVNEHWNYNNDEQVIVEVLSNCPEVELFLNDQSLGVKKLADFPDHIYKWAVPFAGGKLKAVGNKDTATANHVVETSGKPAGIKLTVDNSTLNAGEKGISHVVAQLVDENEIPVRNNDIEITFDADEKLKALGVDNGHTPTMVAYQADKLKTHNGRALLIVQSTEASGEAVIRVSGDGIKESSISVLIK